MISLRRPNIVASEQDSSMPRTTELSPRCLDNPACNARPVFRCKVTLPDADHPPATRAQRPCHKPVPCLVSTQLGCPPLRTIFRHRRVFWFWTAVPETAIHKYRQPLAPEDEIRLAKDSPPSPPLSGSFGCGGGSNMWRV